MRIKIPFAPIYTLQETLGSSHVAANAMLRKVHVGDSEATIPAFPVEARSSNGEIMSRATPRTPDLGEHNADILNAIGLSELVNKPLNVSQ